MTDDNQGFGAKKSADIYTEDIGKWMFYLTQTRNFGGRVIDVRGVIFLWAQDKHQDIIKMEATK